MTVCEFCEHYRRGECQLGLNLRKTMTCREFCPEMEQFFSDPGDFVGTSQIIQMATFFGFQKTELKKITLMATQEERARAQGRFNEDVTIARAL
jgi:hypothetical protein